MTNPSTQPDAVARGVTHPCVLDSPPAWVPLSKAQVLRMAIELRRIRRVTQQEVAGDNS
ncbi:MAG: hypothetical protein ACKVQA_15310 [Burkholderiales bacterium]